MSKKIVHFYKNKGLEWRKIEVPAELVNKRPAYTNNEIVLELKKKSQINNHSAVELASFCDIDINTAELMLSGKCKYSFRMLKAASLYLNIPYNELTRVLEDDVNFSCRGCTDDETEDLFDIINFMFNEMIKQQRLAQ